MILTDKVEVKISASNMNYWRSLGYKFENPAPRWGIIPKIFVEVNHLQEKSNVYVECLCDKCGNNYSQRISRNTDICELCRKKERMYGNNLGIANKGKNIPSMTGENHPRWNPNKSEYRSYASKVRSITESNDLSVLENSDKPRTLCGIEGGYQLDHIIPIKYGFDNNIDPEIIGNIKNLRFIPWEENRTKDVKIKKSKVKNLISEILRGKYKWQF